MEIILSYMEPHPATGTSVTARYMIYLFIKAIIRYIIRSI